MLLKTKQNDTASDTKPGPSAVKLVPAWEGAVPPALGTRGTNPGPSARAACRHEGTVSEEREGFPQSSSFTLTTEPLNRPWLFPHGLTHCIIHKHTPQKPWPLADSIFLQGTERKKKKNNTCFPQTSSR